MGVHFIYRCPDVGPTEKRIRHFPGDASITELFRRIWRPIADPQKASRHAEKLLGFKLPHFAGLFTAIAEQGLPPREDIEELLPDLSWGFSAAEINGSEDA